MNKKISFCMVNWNGGETLLQSIRSIIEEAELYNYEIVLVDNNSSDNSLHNLPGTVRLIQNKENVLFSIATNQSIMNSNGDYLVLLNNDVVFSSGSLRYYLDRLENNDKIIIAPKLMNMDGSIQLSIRNILNPIRLINSMLRMSRRANNKWIIRQFNYNKEQMVEQPLFSLLLMSRYTFNKVGWLDNKYPLFFNDVDWFHRAKDKGVITKYIPGPPILHKHGLSTGKKPFKKIFESTKSMLMYFYKYHPVSFFPLSLLIIASGFIRLLKIKQKSRIGLIDKKC